MKSNLEIKLKTDAFDMQKFLKRYNRLKVYVVSCDTIRVYFDEARISAKKLLKIIQQVQGNGKRIRNVESVKEINETEA